LDELARILPSSVWWRAGVACLSGESRDLAQLEKPSSQVKFRIAALAGVVALHKFRLARADRKGFGYLGAGVARLKLGVVWHRELSLDALETRRRGNEITIL
jgi:hypothetical protein